ncbi:MAG: GyrI-like domain-containing protein [Streptococcaceae bacterium]|jgi:AraC family transcriptional regulator|nr:GyrI-like domain-containing protein [Streptococcaceae bacterium]
MKFLKLETKPSFGIVGYRKSTSVENNANLSDIPRFWRELTAAQQQALSQILIAGHAGMIGVSANEKKGHFDYWLAVVSLKNAVSADRFERLEIPEANYAVFSVKGALPEALEQAWREIYQDWLPQSGFQLANRPQIEWTPAGKTQSQDYGCEIWLAVEAKTASGGAWKSVVAQYEGFKK